MGNNTRKHSMMESNGIISKCEKSLYYVGVSDFLSIFAAGFERRADPEALRA